MTQRERVLQTLRFEDTDRPAYDIMEGQVWWELQQYFREHYGLDDNDAVLAFLDTDFRWLWIRDNGAAVQEPEAFVPVSQREILTKSIAGGPLSQAETIAEVEGHDWPDPSWRERVNFKDARSRWPHHAIVYSPGWNALFWKTCEAFGMEQALVKMVDRPDLFEAAVQCYHQYCMELLHRDIAEAGQFCDICYFGDDFASQQSMMLSPEHWRQFIRPYLTEQVQLARSHGMYVLYHSCGAVRPVLSDLIDIGVSGLLVFQTTALGMDRVSIARDFGGHLVFYGGIDAQHLLSYGTNQQVRATVSANVSAFAPCGGYVVANSHHGVASIRGDNIVSMCKAARQLTSSI